MKKITQLLVAFVALFTLGGCGGGGSVEAIVENCNPATIIKENSVSDECRDAVKDWFNSEADNLSNIVVPLGQGVVSNRPTLFVAGASLTGEPLVMNSSTIKVEALVGGSFVTLQPSDYNLKPLLDFEHQVLISLSSVLDYSASMRDGDLDNAIEIYTGIFKLFDGFFEGEIFYFSNEVTKIVPFASELSILLGGIERDNDYVRNMTALHDGIGEGLEGLTHRDTPIKLLVVATDGQENNSKNYDKASIIAKAKEGKIRIIFLGSLFSDVDDMRDIAKETNGFFIYTYALLDLKNKALKLMEILKNIQSVEITNTTYNGVTQYKLTIDGKSIVFDMI